MIKIGETAKLLDCTPATLRNYVKRFPEYLSPDATSQRRKRFSDKDISTLQKIKSLLDGGHKYDEVPEMLDDVSIPEIIEPGQDDTYAYDTSGQNLDQDTALVEMKYFDRFQALLEGEQERHEQELNRLEEKHQETISAKDETIANIKDENQRLREQLERERLPWWRKLRG